MYDAAQTPRALWIDTAVGIATAVSLLSGVDSAAPKLEILMSILAWVVLGLIAGFIASKLVNRSGEGVIMDILLGIGGALVGGWLFHVFGMHGVTGLNLYSMLVAIVGAAVVLIVYHALVGRSGLRSV
jgi:uncharacterized membrane protein YeaQ/YmgE (transglycosylase-associated protein family)